MQKIKELGLDDEFGAYYDAEFVHRKEINSARNDGRKETAISIAKSMLAKKMDISLISELTGLSKKQIAKLI